MTQILENPTITDQVSDLCAVREYGAKQVDNLYAERLALAVSYYYTLVWDFASFIEDATLPVR